MHHEGCGGSAGLLTGHPRREQRPVRRIVLRDG
jgi:hypothetical protein